MTDTSLDLSGLKCPLPALKTRKALQRLGPGDSLVVTCTDPMAAIDIPHLLLQTGDMLLERSGGGESALVFRIQKKTGT
jgi:tRNA 2-thiouridine synthesizing protein A